MSYSLCIKMITGWKVSPSSVGLPAHARCVGPERPLWPEGLGEARLGPGAPVCHLLVYELVSYLISVPQFPHLKNKHTKVSILNRCFLRK